MEEKDKNKIEEISMEEENKIINFGKKITSKINPNPQLLNRILNDVEVSDVTNFDLVRNNIEKGGRNNLIINPFLNFINQMSKYTKITSGVVVVSAIVLALVFLNKNDGEEIAKKDNLLEQSEPVMMGSEKIEVDSLVAELLAVDSTFEDPAIDDSDLLLDLTNAQDYEI